jgi:hypothetical protein
MRWGCRFIWASRDAAILLFWVLAPWFVASWFGAGAIIRSFLGLALTFALELLSTF